jgi:hypothetical protein
MLEKLLGENSELSAEAKASIVEAFDSAVQAKLDEIFDVKVSEKALELVEAKDAEYSKYLEEAEATHKKEADEFKNSVVESIDAYLEQYVSEMVSENLAGMENDINQVKAKAIVETFEKLGLTVDITEKTSEEVIAESVQVIAKELEDLKVKFNDAINENISLKNGIIESKKSELVKESAEKLTEIQKEKFLKLVETFGDSEDFDSFAKKVSIAVDSLSTITEEIKKESPKTEETTKVKSRFL